MNSMLCTMFHPIYLFGSNDNPTVLTILSFRHAYISVELFTPASFPSTTRNNILIKESNKLIISLDFINRGKDDRLGGQQDIGRTEEEDGEQGRREDSGC